MRTFEVEISEEDLELLTRLLRSESKRCLNNAKMARDSGFGSAKSIEVSDRWEIASTECLELIDKLCENAN